MICISVVSHGHGIMVDHLVERLLSFPEVSQILLTRNIQESSKLRSSDRIEIITNKVPLGFAANHNAAFFLKCNEPLFCVLNPDIELPNNPFPGLLDCLEATGAALIAPKVVAPDGTLEDSIRRFPTIRSLLAKIFKSSEGCHEEVVGQSFFFPEWVAGMFMLYNVTAFKAIGGFDPNYFLYYEDVDICVRLWRDGYRIVACPTVSVLHAARRESRHNWRFLRWHLASMARYFYKHAGRLPRPDLISK